MTAVLEIAKKQSILAEDRKISGQKPMEMFQQSKTAGIS
jgi:hypothetical protein